MSMIKKGNQQQKKKSIAIEEFNYEDSNSSFLETILDYVKTWLTRIIAKNSFVVPRKI